MLAMIVDCAVYQDGHRRSGALKLEQAYEAAREQGTWAWLGLFEPTTEEFDSVRREFNLHELAIEDAVKAHQRPKLEVYGDSLFVVLRTARYVDPEEVISFGQIMLFIGPGFVITVRHGEASRLRDVRGQLEGNPDLLRHGPGAVLYAVIDHVVDDYVPVLAGVDTDLREIELEVFSPEPTDPSERIYRLTREVLEFHRATAPLMEPLHRLVRNSVPMVVPALRDYLRDVLDHLHRVVDEINDQSALLSSMLDAHLARVTQAQTEVTLRQNEDVRRISSWAAILAVPTMIAGVYGMNFKHMPELTWSFGYPLVIGVIVAACSFIYRLFRRSGWL
jgi:magnesium transporter